MIKNQIINGKCIDYTYDGLGVVRYDTFCIFVKDMIVGEEADIIITAVKKGYGYGKIAKLTVTSEERVNNPCSISKPCGGCQLQHMSVKEQARFKQSFVEQNIRNIAKLDIEVNPIISMESPYRYRNKVMLPVGKDKDGKCIIGFYRYNSHDIIPVSDCLLQSDKANRLVNKLKELFDKYALADEVRHIMIRDMSKTSEVMLVLVTYKEKVNNLQKVVTEIVEFDPSIKSVIQNINGEDTNVVLGKKEKLLYGSAYIQDELCGLKFNISSHSFYQVNTYQTEVLYNKAIELAEVSKDDTVLDLYCGVGTIGLITSKHVKKVIGAEIVEEAVNDGKENARINGITNDELICGDAQKVTEQLMNQGIRFDAIIVDPPRKGCSKETLEYLVSLNSPKIVYVSCNPSTLARDLAILKEDYNVKIIQPVDMFPNTYHCETIALLVRR